MPQSLRMSLMFLLLAGCTPESPQSSQSPQAAAPQPASPYAGMTAFAGATLWDGTAAPPMENAVLLVQNGRVQEVLSGPAPEGAYVVDLDGTWIMPGMINAHGHVSGRWAANDVEDPAGQVRGDLALYARYGVTPVNSLGGEPQAAMAERAARENPALQHARLYLAGPVIADSKAAAARAATAANIAQGVDWIKIRIDDNLGAGEKMPWDAVQAVFDAAHAANASVATHIFYMDDALRVLEMGSGLIAHSVRDREVDEAFVERLLETGICYVPTLMREVSTFVYAARPEFFDDPFFLEAAKGSEVQRVSDPEFIQRIAQSGAPAAYGKALRQAQDNLKILSDAGAPIAFGTDSGPAGRFPGYFEHLELALMIEAGLTPREALMSATSVAADCLGLRDLGTLEHGKWADFLVLAGDPLGDIANTRSLQAVYIAGNEIPR